jgi:predicted double-glycine peptidase
MMPTRKIPKGAVKIRLSHVQQMDDYSCGAAAFMAIAVKRGVGPERLEEFKKKLRTNPKFGTYFADIENFANELGFRATTETGMRLRRLKKLLDKKIPVILVIQAYATVAHNYVDKTRNDQGHYVVAVGYDENGYFYFIDPSIPGLIGYLHRSQLKQRWRDDQGRGKPEVYHRLGIVIRPGRNKKGKSHARFIE